MSSSGGERDQGLIGKWRLRHAYPDAVGVWATSTGVAAHAFAFNAIAQDPRVLHRAAASQALRMATQAEAFMVSLGRSGEPTSDAWGAVARLVEHAIEQWRDTLRVYNRHNEARGPPVAGVSAAPHVANDPWQVAMRNFPYVDDATGVLATRILREFGAAMLERARKPWDHLIALAVLRHAARRLRGEVASNGQGHVIGDVQTVQAYCAKIGCNPLLVGYAGPGKPAQQALGLLRDARTLRDAVPGPAWQQARSCPRWWCRSCG